ncbi:conserved hypothetical protein, Rubrerythrin fusion protein [Candidatus Desulfarcum epimagneticum]|uniref:Rhodanese domain-containing protein n=1 Tax=uncultured Desulfobacteraceae bacterium TaxID=218296 RepID=A0A484HGQ7_9BACT|nr:conserved hypothetical protein, Rubrerythrin fusion protein [uncultured Desulfobacteraceae bacterium]
MMGKGFENVYDLSGGIRSWEAGVAFKGEERGIELFDGKESPEKTLVAAYSLERGLRDFYLSMMDRVESPGARKLFRLLSDIETKHQDHVFEAYIAMTRKPLSREEFESRLLPEVVEGGLSTEEYAGLFMPDWESEEDIVSLAMSIENQAFDLYSRVSQRTENPESRAVLSQIADEEREHLRRLGRLMDEIAGGRGRA